MSSGVSRKIDVHHHFFPSALNKAKKDAEVGWRTPEGVLPWTPEISLKVMDTLGIDIAVLSLPANAAGAVGQENRKTARDHNLFAANVCKTYPGRFGFFASLPFLNDTEGVLAEITHALDHLQADGIALASSCGLGSNAAYIADDRYDPMWEELNRRKATVFLHGTQTPSSTPYPHDFLGLPVTEVPNETFKAAAHLVVTGKKRKYPDVKIILAHLGGTTPFLAARVAVLSQHMGCILSPEEALEDFKSFYYDTALSSYETNLAAMERFVSPDRILFGTDIPAMTADMAGWYTKNLEAFYEDNAVVLNNVMRTNALELLPRLQRFS